MTPKRPRKPATILRYLRVNLYASRFYLNRGDWARSLTLIAESQGLTRELSRAIATSGKAPRRP